VSCTLNASQNQRDARDWSMEHVCYIWESDNDNGEKYIKYNH